MYDLGSERAGRGGAKQRRRLSYEAVIGRSYERAGGGKMPPMYDVRFGIIRSRAAGSR